MGKYDELSHFIIGNVGGKDNIGLTPEFWTITLLFFHFLSFLFYRFLSLFFKKAMLLDMEPLRA
ncbi:hypothetical protein [Niallia sp. FSL W8-1348]|uniref:hypothetical protein n=1 Tax=Niallia sp. FSL W8-1348 TaxID=2954656 RepID=UPI0030F605E8